MTQNLSKNTTFAPYTMVPYYCKGRTNKEGFYKARGVYAQGIDS
jgi:hypothetical protein